MNLGAFSISLTVKDLTVSRRFYESLGFTKLGGDEAHNFLLLKNGEHVIGLFQGMFEKNMLTFNPGWNQAGQDSEKFTDLRELQRQLRENGMEPTMAVDENSTGPGSFMLEDPDGNPILIDQHRG